jgi:hypothetical protein
MWLIGLEKVVRPENTGRPHEQRLLNGCGFFIIPSMQG